MENINQRSESDTTRDTVERLIDDYVNDQADEAGLFTMLRALLAERDTALQEKDALRAAINRERQESLQSVAEVFDRLTSAEDERDRLRAALTALGGDCSHVDLAGGVELEQGQDDGA